MQIMLGCFVALK